MTGSNVTRSYTRTEFATERVTAYHNGDYVDFHFWADPDKATAVARARQFAGALGIQASVLQLLGKEGQGVRVLLL